MKFQRFKTAKLFAGLAAVLLLFTSIPAQTAAGTAMLAERERQLAENIRIETIREITAVLSAPEMEGRGTMQAGGDRAARWIADRMKSLGLKPLGDKGSYLQEIDFRETVLTNETSFKLGDQTLAHGSEFGIAPFSGGNKSSSGELVFVAYGMVIDKMKRNDLGDMNLQGKIVVMLEGPPQGVTKKQWTDARAGQIFVNNLWQKGVAGIIVIGHGREDNPPETMIDYFKRRQLDMPDEPTSPPQMPLYVYVSPKGAEKLFSKSATSLKDALAQAESNDFKPVKLDQKAEIKSKIKTAKGVSYNVAGYLEGSDPTLKAEAVLFSAHYDGYGIEDGKIYHAAADNALGTAEMLAVAEAYSKTAVKPKRSMIFLAVTGEEYGLYGSKYWAKKPTWDIKKVAANLNLDGVGTEVYAPVKTMVGYGAEHSTLGALLEDVSKAMGVMVVGDPIPDERIFYRSDHYSFVERGVPALMLMGAPAGDIQATVKRMQEWEKTGYHQPSDTIQPDWAWEGAETVAEIMGVMGLRISDAQTMPSWLANGRFGKLERGNTKDLPKEK